MTSLVARGDPVEPVIVLWIVQERGLLTDDITPSDLMALISTPASSREHWGDNVLHRALLARAHAVATRITAYTDHPGQHPRRSQAYGARPD